MSAQHRTVHVPRERLTGWVGRFLDRHGAPAWGHDGETVTIEAADGTVARLDALDPAGSEDVRSLRTLVGWPRVTPRLAVVLLRRGRFAVGYADGDGVVAHKSGNRYVQSRTAAGGWSQQRYQRRRDNQAAELVRHVADHLVRLAEGLGGARWPQALVVGGDRPLVESVLDDPRLAAWRRLPRQEAFDIPDPTHQVLRDVVARARGVTITVVEPAPTEHGRLRDMTAHAMSEARELIPAAAASVTALVDRIPDEAWGRPSPCEGWTVRDVLNHLTAEHLWAPRLLAGESLEDVGAAYDGDVLGDDPAGAWRSAQTRSVLAWGQLESDDLAVHVTSGRIPAREYAEQMLVDLTVHAWDLARGAGLTVDLVPEAVEHCLGYETPRVEATGIDGIFDAPVSTSSRDRVDQLVALTGRDPGWRR